jgi:hypothetical protein
MEAATEERLVSFLGCGIALSVITLSIIEDIQVQRSVREAAAFGWIVDVSPDRMQMNFRMALALAVGSISLWSPRGRRWTIFLTALLVGFSLLLFSQTKPFDRSEPVIHLAAISCLTVAIIFIRRPRSNLLTALLAGVFVLVNYVDWFWYTQRLKRLSESESLDPYTRLNNLFYGAHPWHVVLLAVTICLIIWEVRLLARRTTASSVAGAD